MSERFLSKFRNLSITYIRKQDRQCERKRNTEARSSNCCRTKTLSITYSDCVFVALGIQHAMPVGYIVLCGLPRCTVFSHII